MRRAVCAGVFLLLITVAAPKAWAGAWTLPKGRWYLEYYWRLYQSKKDFNAEGNSNRKSAVGMFRDIRNEWKAEYGVTDWLNLLASVPYQSGHSRDDNGDSLNTGVGDIYVRAKARLLNKPVFQDKSPLVGSVQFSWKIPSAYDPAVSPGLGDGQVDFESRLMLSQSWVFDPYEVRVPVTPPARPEAARRPVPSREAAMQEAVDEAAWMMFREAMAGAEELAESYYGFRPVREDTFEPMLAAAEEAPARDAAPRATTEMEVRYNKVVFVNLEGGLNARNEDPANEFPMVVEAGFTPWKKLMLVGSLESTLSVNSTNEQEESYSKWGLRAILNLRGDGFASVFRRGNTTVNFEVGYNDIFAGRNTGDAYELFGKLSVLF